MMLPDDMFRLELLPNLKLRDIVNLDNACMNKKYRPQLMDKMSGMILIGDEVKSMKALLFKWLGTRRIYLIKMNLLFDDENSFSCSMQNNYVDQFRFIQDLFMIGTIIDDDMAIFIISHCPFLLSIVIGDDSGPTPQVTDQTLQSIADHCTGLQSLSVSVWEITDAGLITISEHCPNLQSLQLYKCNQITDASIISISIYCTGLQTLNLESCDQITDASIISISTICTGLQALNLESCDLITDASILSISTHCTGLKLFNLCKCRKITDASILSMSNHLTELQSLHLYRCYQITDASIISISTHCTRLHSLDLYGCHQITDASIISISENCTGLEELFVADTDITDVSLIAIAKNCTGLQYLNTYYCDSLSSEELCHQFKSVSELRAVLLSIYPSLLI